MKEAFEISEKFRCPVILRSTTSVSHSRALVETGERLPAAEAKFERNPLQFVPIPVWGRKLRAKVEERIAAQAAEAAGSGLNRIFEGDGGHGLGIISGGIAALHCRDIFPEADILKLGWAWPFPDELIRRFAATVKRVVVIEEADPDPRRACEVARHRVRRQEPRAALRRADTCAHPRNPFESVRRAV